MNVGNNYNLIYLTSVAGSEVLTKSASSSQNVTIVNNYFGPTQVTTNNYNLMSVFKLEQRMEPKVLQKFCNASNEHKFEQYMPKFDTLLRY